MLENQMKNVLIIEDEVDLNRNLAFLLEKTGFRVLTALTGEEGLEIARKSKPSAIVLDLMLPGIQGEEVCKAIREDDDEAVQKIPILIVSAKKSDVDRIVGKVIGANAYVVKPYDFRHLLSEIKKLASPDLNG